MVTFLRQFKHYLLGQKILLRTDHASLKWLKIFKEPEGKLARWLSIIEIFDLKSNIDPGPNTKMLTVCQVFLKNVKVPTVHVPIRQTMHHCLQILRLFWQVYRTLNLTWIVNRTLNLTWIVNNLIVVQCKIFSPGQIGKITFIKWTVNSLITHSVSFL